jgi:hypothetical protein
VGRLTRRDLELLEGLDRAVAFDRIVDRAMASSPSAFPPELTVTNYVFDDGTYEHVFHHRSLGEVGRIRVERRGGRTHTTGLVAGTTDDPQHAQRDAVFKPLMDAFSRADGGHSYESKHMQCACCGAIAASIIFIDEADPHDFEACAREMHPDYSSRSAPTWIIAPPVGEGPEPERAADIMKVWPQREPMQRLRPAEFNPVCDQFVDDHCPRATAKPTVGLPKKRRR